MTHARNAFPDAPSALMAILVATVWAGGPQAPAPAAAQEARQTPIRQSTLTSETASRSPLTLRDAARDDRWLGLGVRDVRWAADGTAVYFRWNEHPTTEDVPEADPWYAAAPDGRSVRLLDPDLARDVPGPDFVRSPDGRQSVWTRDGALHLYEAGRGTRRAVALDAAARDPRFTIDGEAVHFQAGATLYQYTIGSGTLDAIAKRIERPSPTPTDAATWLRNQQSELFEHVRQQHDRANRAAASTRDAQPHGTQVIPLPEGVSLDQMARSPDGRWITFRARTPSRERPPTRYVDFVDPSGYATVREARAKVGEPRDVYRLGVVAVDPSVPADSVKIRWIDVEDAQGQATVSHGPFWSLDGVRSVVQFIGEDHEDVWIAEVDLESASARVLAHDHDEAWIGGPPIQANYLEPALMRWLADGSLVFASERSGWSHLYLLEPDGNTRALTEGAWEVRGASLSPDGTTWLLQAGREHPSDDQLFLMPATGGTLERLTGTSGRHEGWWSPDGRSLAVVSSESTSLPDLFVREALPDADPTRVTRSGADAFYEHPLVRPEIVSFPHPDGGPVWAALYRPATQNAERAAIVHVHGGGYRQFAHRGYSVYGYALHLGFIHYMLEQGYTVLDFDYRGSAGFGRDYRTDISESMGISDTDGAVAAAGWLTENANVDARRIGIYGVSYGGFLTLTSLFRYPGVFAAGVARAAVTDWAHYSDGWTSRILGVPHENSPAYRISSPINYAEGLEDALLITHGLVDDNVHFQDAARLIQRLIELEKEFDVMVYPIEPHTVETEASRFDLLRRQAAFFDRHLRGIEPGP
jgi:dipeptidyl aminopeptidase/acylaminoacyl peptidase